MKSINQFKIRIAKFYLWKKINRKRFSNKCTWGDYFCGILTRVTLGNQVGGSFLRTVKQIFLKNTLAVTQKLKSEVKSQCLRSISRQKVILQHILRIIKKKEKKRNNKEKKRILKECRILFIKYLKVLAEKSNVKKERGKENTKYSIYITLRGEKLLGLHYSIDTKTK